jgi:hypothetical protein
VTSSTVSIHVGDRGTSGSASSPAILVRPKLTTSRNFRDPSVYKPQRLHCFRKVTHHEHALFSLSDTLSIHFLRRTPCVTLYR